MNKIISVVLPTVVSLVVVLPVGAQEASTNAAPANAAPTRQDLRQEFRTQTQDAREKLRTEVKEESRELHRKSEEQRIEFRTRVEEKRTELKSRIESERVVLKERLQKIRDEQKKQAVERVANRLNELNDNRVKHFTEVLNKLDKVLGRIASRTDKAASRGLDVASVKTAIEVAKTAIASARAAVEAQAGKTYAIAVTTEGKLRTDVEASRKALRDDLKKVFDAVKAARNAVHEAATTLAQIPRVNEEPTVPPTNSAPVNSQ